MTMTEFLLARIAEDEGRDPIRALVEAGMTYAEADAFVARGDDET